MREIDLHTHTNISDGSESPADTVAHAKALGLKAIAITVIINDLVYILSFTFVCHDEITFL